MYIRRGSIVYPLDALMLDNQFRRRLPHNANEAEAKLEDPRTAAIDFLEPATSVHVGELPSHPLPFDRTAKPGRPWFPRSGADTRQACRKQYCMFVAR